MICGKRLFVSVVKTPRSRSRSYASQLRFALWNHIELFYDASIQWATLPSAKRLRNYSSLRAAFCGIGEGVIM